MGTVVQEQPYDVSWRGGFNTRYTEVVRPFMHLNVARVLLKCVILRV